MFGDDLQKILPIIREGGSDTATFDNVLEFLYMAGRSLPHAILMMIPEPWSAHESMSPELKAFYEYHSSLMEAWDGPASIAFTDGTLIGAVLDRNGLRPSRYYVTKDDLVVMASEVGVLDIPDEDILVKERLHPGPHLPRRHRQGPHRRRRRDQTRAGGGAAVRPLAGRAPRGHRGSAGGSVPAGAQSRNRHEAASRRSATRRKISGLILAPMATGGEEAIGSMGTDTALAVLSDRSRLLYDYFSQGFAQVTNPPLDAIREELVTTMGSTVGPEGNLLDPRPESCRQIKIKYPVIDNDQLAKLRHVYEPGFKAITLPMLFDPRQDGPGLEHAMEHLKRQASAAVEAGYTILILSDRGADRERAPIPSLLATAGVHHHLVRQGTRTRCGLVIETGDAREVHHCALLLGYGAGAVNPYLAFETLDDMIRQELLVGVTHAEGGRALHPRAQQGHPEGDVQDGHLDAAELLRRADLRGRRPRPGVRRPLLHVDGVAHRRRRHRRHRRRSASSGITTPTRRGRLGQADLEWGGEYQWRRDGELHLFNPDTVFKLQHATRSGSTRFSRSTPGSSTIRASGSRRCAGCCSCGRPPSRSPSTRSSPSSASSSASRPARCRTGRSARKRTRRSRSR